LLSHPSTKKRAWHEPNTETHHAQPLFTRLLYLTIILQMNQTSTNKKTPKTKNYPVKDFFLSRSLIIEFDCRKAKGKSLTKTQEKKLWNIYLKRDKAMDEIKRAISKYYGTVINGDYRTDGMPEIRRGIRG
jgi:hypothetical protein